jgi:cytosine/adenosine deaminase-related metal-dependent hydrolase
MLDGIGGMSGFQSDDVRMIPISSDKGASQRAIILALSLALLLGLVPWTSSARADLLITNATLLTMKPGENGPLLGYMLVDDNGRIAALAAGAPPGGTRAATTVDATGKIMIPGFVSAHSHLYQSAFRGLGIDHNTGEWRQDLALYSRSAADDDFYWFTLHGALDHLTHGITSVFNFSYSGRAGEYNQHQLRAVIDSGMRSVHAFAQNRSIPLEQQYQSFLGYYEFAKRYFNDPRFLRIGITGDAASLAYAKFDKRLMDEFGALNQAHFLSEAYRLMDDGRRIGKEELQKQFQNFVEAGALGPNLYFGHFIHTNEAMLRETAAAGSGMSWQPLSNGRLGSGIADIPKYVALGVKVGMGVDGEASADIADPFENMRTGLYFIRASYGSASAMSALDVLRMSTIGSAALMGVADRVGSLEVGKLADFVVISPPSPVFDVAATVVLAVNNANVEAVYVGGKKLVDHLVPVRSDLGTVSQEVEMRIGRLQAAAAKK